MAHPGRLLTEHLARRTLGIAEHLAHRHEKEGDMQLVERVRRMFSRGTEEEREQRRIAKAKKQAETLAERGRAESRSTTPGPGGT
jgi:hypothetical protein